MRSLLTIPLLALCAQACAQTLPPKNTSDSGGDTGADSTVDSVGDSSTDSSTDSTEDSDTAPPHDPSCDDLSDLVGLSLFDANGDEWHDLLLVHQSGAWCVSLNYGLSLRPQERVMVTQPAEAPGFRYALGDLDGDGDTDLAWGQATEYARYQDLSVALWADGAWTPVSDAPLLTADPSDALCALDELVIADLGGDGQDELVLVDRVATRWCARSLSGEALGEEVEWFFGQGTDLAMPLAGRVDGDACDELIGFYQPTTDRPDLGWNDGLWKLVGPSSEHPTEACTPIGEADRATNWRTVADEFGIDAVYTAVQDVDGDGLGDALYVNAEGDWRVAPGASTSPWGFFADLLYSTSLGAGAELFTSGDLNGDGHADLLQLDVESGAFTCALGGPVVLEACPAGFPAW